MTKKQCRKIAQENYQEELCMYCPNLFDCYPNIKKPIIVNINKTDYNFATFIAANFHHCPFSDNCGIDFENECGGWGGSNCKRCLMKYSDKLNMKENTK